MKLIGNLHIGSEVTDLLADTKQVTRFNFPFPVRVAKLTAYLDGQGSGNQSQVFKPVIYTSTGNLVAQGLEVTIPLGAPPSWVDARFAVPPTLAAGDYDLGFLLGPSNAGARIYSDLIPGVGLTNSDTYADGAASTFGAASPPNHKMSIFATYFNSWVLPDEEDDGFARLPFELAQSVLGQGSSVKNYSGVAEWHGTGVDPERGSFCIVKTGGPLAGLVGERVRISSRIIRKRSVVAFVHNESSELTEDLSLTRRLFIELALLSLDSLDVHIEVLG